MDRVLVRAFVVSALLCATLSSCTNTVYETSGALAGEKDGCDGVHDAGVETSPDLTPVVDLLPPPDLQHRTIRVMPFGDSITAGLPSVPNGYRKLLFDKLTADSYVIDYIGSKHQGDATLLDQDHEGNPGWKSYDFLVLPSQRSNGSTLVRAKLPIDVFVYMLDSNGCGAGIPQGGWEMESIPENMITLVHQLYAASPSSLFLIVEIPPLPAGSPGWPAAGSTTYYPLGHDCVINANARFPAAVEYLRSQGVNARYVPTGLINADVCPAGGAGGWPGAIGGDCIHPNNIGYQHLAAAIAAGFEQWVTP